MSARKDFYFRQRVTESELDSAFSDLEDADHNIAADLGFTGVIANAVVSQHAPVADLTVDVSGPGAALDQLGQRIFFSALQNVDVSKDENAVATSVSAAGKEKTVSVFVKFDRSLSDPRVDGNSLTVFFRRDESFKFAVAQGAEAPAGTSIPPPLRSDAILLGDVVMAFGQSQVLATNISVARRQDAFVLTGSPRSVRRGRTVDVAADLLSFYDAHTTGTADRHPATAVDYTAGGAWADGTPNPAATVKAQLDKVVADLAAATGSRKVGSVATLGAPNSLTAGTVKSQLDALLADINAHINDASAAHAAAALSYAGGSAWADGTTNPASTVEAQLDKIVSDLAALAGAARIGAAASAGIPAGSVRSQLDYLVSIAGANPATANTWTAAQTFNGATGDSSAALKTTAVPSIRKLLWEIAGTGNYSYRFYSTNRTMELTLNARWQSGSWVKDNVAWGSSKLELNNFELHYRTHNTGASPFADSAWTGDWQVTPDTGQVQSFDSSGEWTSPGATVAYVAAEGVGGSGIDKNIGGGATFRKVFPATPSSFTFSNIATGNLSFGPATYGASQYGIGAYAAVSDETNSGFFFATVTAS
jgi:hypothetical protein